MIGKVRRLATYLLLESPGRRRTLDEWADALVVSGERIAARLKTIQHDDDKNRAMFNHTMLNHIIGIERWGQRRLRVFLGEPAVRGEYDGYRPKENLKWAEQIAAFEAARAETVAIVRQLAQKDEQAADTMPATVVHNQYGPLSSYAWIRYLDLHAAWEARRIR